MNGIKKNNIFKNIIWFGSLVLVYLLMQLKFLNDMWFGTDELDIMVLGKGIAKGQLLYVEALSQHMPFSYYISALFYKLGAISVTQQRIAFYVFFSLLWTSIVFLYRKKVDKRALVLYPFLHCCMIQNYDLGTQILSEHLAGIGAIILLLEFIIFSREQKLTMKSCILISLAIVLTFGTIFIAIYPIFFIGVGVVLIEIRCKIEKKIKLKDWIVMLLQKYIKLIIVVAIPWVMLLCYYILTHSLSEFINGAYTINREIYPKYNGGTGSNIFSMFFVPIEMISNFIKYGFNLAEWNYTVVLQWIYIIGGIIYIIESFKNEGKIVGIVSLLYTFALGIRGIFNFHGTACVEVLAFMTTYVLCVYGFRNRDAFSRLSFVKRWCIVMVFIVIASGYCNNISQIANIKLTEEQTNESKVISEITDKDESIWMLTFDNQDAMLSDRTVVGASPTTPWTWEGFGKKQFKKFKKNAPRVAIFTEEHECWGYKIKNYAPEVVKYVKKNYTLMPDTSNVYVRNEYYEEACKKIKQTKEN